MGLGKFALEAMEHTQTVEDFDLYRLVAKGADDCQRFFIGGQ